MAKNSGGLVLSFFTLKHLQWLDEVSRNFSIRDQGQKKKLLISTTPTSHLNLFLLLCRSWNRQTRTRANMVNSVAWILVDAQSLPPATPPKPRSNMSCLPSVSADKRPGPSCIAVTLYSGCLPRMLGSSHFFKEKNVWMRLNTKKKSHSLGRECHYFWGYFWLTFLPTVSWCVHPFPPWGYHIFFWINM